jgi:hypothetical protein
MSTSPLSPEDIRAAAEAHRELGPEYSDAVVASFIDKVDREITARVDARLARPRQPQPTEVDTRRVLMKGVAIGATVTGTCLLAAMSGNQSEGVHRFLVVVLLWLVIGAGRYALATRARQRPPSGQAAADR